MSALVLEDRVETLEELMAALLRAQERTQQQLDQTSREMAEFKDEMAEFKDEMQRDRRSLRQTLADLAHKMGTLAEDLVAPSIPRILHEIAGCPEAPSMLGVRLRKRLADGRSQEYDVVATCGDYLLINETKSRLRPEDIPQFIELLHQVRTFLPEYQERRVVGALASFYMDPTLIVHGERQGIIMLGVIDGLMQVLNTTEFRLQTY